MTKICVLIPTYNEAAAIAGVVKGARSQGLDVLVIDDGSADSTASIARSQGAKVIVNAKNMGKGACLIKGFDYCLEKGYEAVLTMDGDGQHLPGEASRFIAALERNDGCGIVIGNRMSRRGAMPAVRVITNKIMSGQISRVCRQRIPDTQCGYRLIRKEVLRKVGLKTTKYETESEILIQAAKHGFTIVSIPITSVYLNERSHINPFIDTLRFIRFMITSGRK